MHADRTNNCGYNARLRPYANVLRKKMTKAEACLWKYALRARQMKGYQFLRQRPVLQFIADFLCPELKLIIEVDGLHHHLLDESVTADRLKDRELIRAGFRVVRLSNKAVLTNIEGVRDMLEEIIEELVESGEVLPPARSKGGQEGCKSSKGRQFISSE